MEQIIFKPSLHKYGTCKEFAEGFQLKETDLILTNKYIYEPYFGELDLPCHVVYQEQYGMGEPSDVMAEAILKDISGLSFDRIIAIGGGTIIDLAKVFAVAVTLNGQVIGLGSGHSKKEAEQSAARAALEQLQK